MLNHITTEDVGKPCGGDSRVVDQAEGNKRRFVVPAGQRVTLAFFRKIYRKLQEDYVGPMSDDGENEELSLLMFERTMTRLFRAVGYNVAFDPHIYDSNSNGKVSWREFVMVWKEHQPEMHYSMAERIFMVMEEPRSCVLAKIMSIVVLVLITISSACFITSTMPELGIRECDTCEPQVPDHFQNIDVFFVTVFTIEFLVRLITSSQLRSELVDERILLEQITHENAPATRSAARKILDWLIQPGNLVDLIAILPWYLTKAFEGVDASSLLVLRMVRLGRVVRALRLGRRFQAVIVIMRALKESQKVLSVLVMNLMLGIFIFGALMYFVEGGSWDSTTQSYQRIEGYLLDGTAIKGDTPFVSIPASAWWALVTATTVGYGDHYPTTEGGKAIAALCMVWSLVVLALPIGVVGNTFGRVWEEYEKEKAAEKWAFLDDVGLVRKSMYLIDPLFQAKQATISVYHDGKTGTLEGDAFIGEADVELDLRKDHATFRDDLTLELKPNKAKSRQAVSGTVSFSYDWKPSSSSQPGTLLQGQLWCCLSGASGLTKLDWRQSLMPNAYAIIELHPRVNKDEATKQNKPQLVKTKTIDDSLEPTWKADATIEYLWQNEALMEVEDEIGQEDTLNEMMRANTRNLDATTSRSSDHVITQVQEEIRKLREEQTLIKTEQREFRQELSTQLDSIKSLLQGLNLGAATGSPVVPTGSPVVLSVKSSSQGGGKQIDPERPLSKGRSGAQDEMVSIIPGESLRIMPGMVPNSSN